MNSYISRIKQFYSPYNCIKWALLLALSIYLIDYFNIPSYIIKQFGIGSLISIVAVATIILLISIIQKKLFAVIQSTMVNPFDIVICILFIVVIFCLPYYFLYKSIFNYKNILLITAFIILVVSLCIRITFFRIQNSKAKNYKSNVFDLKAIYEGDFILNDDQLAFIEESDVDYDLLHRGEIINRLFFAISNIKPAKSFVIALEGKWGSGKTTIINNVKKMLIDQTDVIIIDEFDPWVFDNEVSMFRSMLGLLLGKSGIKINLNNSSAIVEAITETIFGESKSKLINILIHNSDEVFSLKKRINNFQKYSGEHVIFFIDNIDRADNKNVIFLFKIIASILDFERVTYVLSYDESRVRDIFIKEKNLDYDYLKKIIQIELVVPELDKSVTHELFARCINNLLSAMTKDGDKDNIGDVNFLIEDICKNFRDIRDFKRFVNSVISLSIRVSHYLYNRDVVSLAYIRFFNASMYNDIFSHKKYFISHDTSYDRDLQDITFKKEEFNAEAKKYFDALFIIPENKKFMKILANMFPYIARYQKKQDIMDTKAYPVIDPSYKEISKNRKICSAKYFDLYFTNSKNWFSEIGRLVEQFINDFDTLENSQDKIQLFESMMIKSTPEFQKEFLERIEVYIDEFDDTFAFALAETIFSESINLDDSPLFLGLNAKSRSELLVWMLLQKSSENDLENFIINSQEKFYNLRTIENIVYWAENGSTRDSDGTKGKILRGLLEKMQNDIIEHDVNLYSDQNYSPKNIFALIKKDGFSKVDLQSYIEPLLSKNNVFRVLFDSIGCIIGSVYTYKISKENLDLLTTKEKINTILEATPPRSKDEEFVAEVYKRFTDNLNDEEGVVSTEPIIIDWKQL